MSGRKAFGPSLSLLRDQPAALPLQWVRRLILFAIPGGTYREASSSAAFPV